MSLNVFEMILASFRISVLFLVKKTHLFILTVFESLIYVKDVLGKSSLSYMRFSKSSGCKKTHKYRNLIKPS